MNVSQFVSMSLLLYLRRCCFTIFAPQNISFVPVLLAVSFNLFTRNVNIHLNLFVCSYARLSAQCGMITAVRVCFLNCSVKSPKNTFYTSISMAIKYGKRPPIAATTAAAFAAQHEQQHQSSSCV